MDNGVLCGETFTPYPTLRERSARTASALAELGIGAGDTVAVLMRNDVPFLEAAYGASLIGAVPVPINWHGRQAEVRYILDDAHARLLVAHADLLHGIRDALPERLPVRAVPTPAHIADRYGVPDELRAPGAEDVEWSAWIESFEPRTAPPTAPPWGMLYTSGTTGRPKGVLRQPTDLNDPAAVRAMAALHAAIGMEPGARTIISGPMYHTAPFTYAVGMPAQGAFVVLQPRFDAEELLALIERHRITHLYLVPTMFVRLLQLPAQTRNAYDLSSLVKVMHAAAPCPPSVKRAMIEWWGPILHEYYGGTESAAVVACDSEEWLAHPGTVGRPVDGATVRIYGEDGTVLAPGQVGDIYVRLNGLPDFTYQGQPEARVEIGRDGLVTCGDVGYLDEDGYLYLCDRKRDMVISGGVNIYPVEIEACLTRLVGVKDCAVFGVPDAEYGESLAAAIELLPGAELTEDQVRAHVRRHLAGFKVPKLVVFHESLPREDSGKIFKRLLREPYWAGRERRI
ncbi:long-chain acyl-CoA synthetase [Thermomonospora echinospora]|uniref:Long-chain acyl-CoA synthetase n=1 Tax=Thermomonospora echinospora TaxID=1992 RepID=A0A1H6E1I6_9ACTN|nr:acyl-CoA synthetase [Thermomonospora echinospora]SEG91470.1 long-chain acyl-CoA synthetase [Thermomonospora echinospora]